MEICGIWLNTRPKIIFGVRLVNRFIESLNFSHLEGVRCILLYIKSMPSNGTFYAYADKNEFNSDWIGDLEKWKVPHVIYLILVLFWSSKK